MIGTVARDALLIALPIMALGIVLAPFAVRTGRRELIPVVFSAVYTNFLLVTIATGGMVVALVTHDFSVGYVAQVGSRATPLFYTVVSLWGALEGSILFWAWVLALYGTLVVWANRNRPGNLIPYTALALLAVSLFFGILLVGPANPFNPVFPVPADGPGPNALLQNNFLFGVHPPLLYLGYVGLTVPFAFAVGAMLSGEVTGDSWLKLSHRWTLLAWGFLSAAIIAGMWWSYEVLGWGGYWAWDPVENASFLPWLTATAYLHSMVVQERRGMLKLWNVNLVVGTFVLTVLGTFLTRSGIISSVHAFTVGVIGYYFLAFIAIVLVSALVMVAGNSERLRTSGKMDSIASRETVFLLNNLFLTAFMFTVLIGTLFPLIAEAIRGVKVSVGAPFFNRMSLPLIVVLLFLMGVGPALPWRSATVADMRSKLLPPLVGAVLMALGAVVAGARNFYGIVAFSFVGYAAVANLREYWIGMSARHDAHGENWGLALFRLMRSNQRRYGGYLAHLGLLIAALGITGSSSFRKELEMTMKPGDTLTIAGQTIRLKEVWGRQEVQRAVIGATVEVLKNGVVIGKIEPRMNYYPSQDQPVVTPDLRSTIGGDLYLTLMAFEKDGKHATIRVIVQPLVSWIWFGGGIVVLGALVGLLPTRRRADDVVADTDAVPVVATLVPKAAP